MDKRILLSVLISISCGPFTGILGEEFGNEIHRDTITDPDEHRNVTELITSKGYPCEQHFVITKDGYILSLQRIPFSKQSPRQKGKPAILVLHGLLSCSSCWVENLANESLGFMLADAGVDVWLGNSRGNKYSRTHVSLSPDDPRYWAFSWDEMAKYDLPAMIDYIIEQTGNKEIYYAGHSQGTEQAFAGFSLDPGLGKKVKTFFALAPVGNLSGVESPIRYLAPFAKDIETRIPVYVRDHPAGTSVQNIAHYSQSILNKKFSMLDFGSPAANMKHYNQTTPPVYDVTKVETPVAIFSGGHDWLADPADVRNLVPQLRNVRINKNIPEWEHLDFIWAMDAPSKCYIDIISMIKSDMESS
uniref:Lysosomal acid lipase/cholesteryl ester hydrolase-like isoform X2 n=1 Tax=Crassostrea virginica TaxID=6565 RepID=A0A8B8CZE2_CRAVI|nr:lysosomal acid lipase/cholesteryl ester hydrolase-like isoform X2 [Crassostrea virginica]